MDGDAPFARVSPPELTFDEPTHTYKVGGVPMPSVTTVLDDVVPLFDKVPFAVLERARQIGTAVHHATALDDLGLLDEASLHPIVMPYVVQWRIFSREAAVRWDLIEHRDYHRRYRYCGTLDRAGRFFKKRGVLDLKTGYESLLVGPQTSAYDEMIEYGGERHVLYLSPDGYRLEMCNGAGDWPDFLGCLRTYNLKRKLQS